MKRVLRVRNEMKRINSHDDIRDMDIKFPYYIVLLKLILIFYLFFYTEIVSIPCSSSETTNTRTSIYDCRDQTAPILSGNCSTPWLGLTTLSGELN